MAQVVRCPSRGFVCVTRSARIRDLVFLHHRRGDESECVSVDESAGHPLGFYRRHVAGNALTSGAAIFVMRVLFDSRVARAVGR